MSDMDVVKLCAPNLLARWVGDFYYICRCFNAIPHVASEVFVWSRYWVFQALREGHIKEFSWSLSCMACWGANNNDERTRDLVIVIEQLIFDEHVPDTVKCEFLLCLCTVVSFYSSKPSHAWAQLVRSDYLEYCRGHQKLQVLLESCPGDEFAAIDDSMKLILEEVVKSRREIDQQLLGNTAEALIAQDRLSGMLSPFLMKCIGLHLGEYAVNILKAWYQVEGAAGIDSEKLLVIYPNYKNELIYSVGGAVFNYSRNLSDNFAEMVDTLNRFLGLSNSVGPDPSSTLHTPDSGRFGVPDEQLSLCMEEALVSFYAIGEAKEYLLDVESQIQGFVSIPSSQHSVQYIFQKYFGDCWPLNVSLESPLPDRKATRVCIWCGAGSMTEEIEMNSVKSVFEHAGMQVDCFSSSETIKEGFISIYESAEYDVIWIMSHGEYDQWSPGSVSIQISAEESLSLNELLKLKLPDADKRRLLFLNICDGATYTNLGGIAKVGIAPALSSQGQCVISHLWPVNPFSAATFGLLYAAAVAEGLGFFSAFKQALDKIRSTKDGVVDAVDECSQDGGALTRRISNMDISFELMAHSGSAVFFQ